MRTMQSFLTFFYILDQCYEQCREDDLGGLLGVISPETWNDGQPMDKAIICDWEKISNPPTVSEKNVIEKTYDFLNYYEKQFGYIFTKTKHWLTTPNNQAVVENAILKTQEMYEKFDYSN